MERYGESLLFSPNAGKYGLEKTPYFGHFTQRKTSSMKNKKSYFVEGGVTLAKLGILVKNFSLSDRRIFRCSGF